LYSLLQQSKDYFANGACICFVRFLQQTTTGFLTIPCGTDAVNFLEIWNGLFKCCLDEIRKSAAMQPVHTGIIF
jgi:hypothetical protein